MALQESMAVQFKKMSVYFFPLINRLSLVIFDMIKYDKSPWLSNYHNFNKKKKNIKRKKKKRKKEKKRRRRRRRRIRKEKKRKGGPDFGLITLGCFIWEIYVHDVSHKTPNIGREKQKDIKLLSQTFFSSSSSSEWKFLYYIHLIFLTSVRTWLVIRRRLWTSASVKSWLTSLGRGWDLSPKVMKSSDRCLLSIPSGQKYIACKICVYCIWIFN